MIKKPWKMPEPSPETKKQTTKTKPRTTSKNLTLSKDGARGTRPQTNSTRDRPAGSKQPTAKRESYKKGGRGMNTDIRQFGVLTKGIKKNSIGGHEDPRDLSKQGEPGIDKLNLGQGDMMKDKL